VDARGQGSVGSDSHLERFTDSAFTLFQESDFVKELTEKPKKKSGWRKLLGKTQISSPRLKVGDVDGAMSQIPNRNRIRGRGASAGRKSEKTEPSSPPQSPATTVQSPLPLPSGSAETLTSVLSSPLESKDTKRITGDDLRKQLSDGLKNGSGKSKDIDKSVKAQISEITEGAVKTSVVETKSFIEKENKGVEKEKEVVQEKSEDKASEEVSSNPEPGSSAADMVRFFKLYNF